MTEDVKELPKYWDQLEQLIDEEINKVYQARKARRKRRDWFSVSNAGYCPRATVLNRLNAKEDDHDARKRRIFWIGDVIHKAIQEMIRKSGQLVAAEEFLAPYGSGDLSGAFDIVVRDKEGDLEMYEMKSKGSGIFWKMVLKDKKPTRNNLYQAVTYWILNKKYNLKKLKIAYFSKEDAAIKVFTVDVTPELVAEVEAWWDAVRDYFNKSILPPVLDPTTPEGKSWCKECTFNRHWCFGDPAIVEDNLTQFEGWTSAKPDFETKDPNAENQETSREAKASVETAESSEVQNTESHRESPKNKTSGTPKRRGRKPCQSGTRE